MRNGNRYKLCAWLCWWKGSYRTYEEWKRLLRKKNKFKKNSSYRTYEEWKPRYDIEGIIDISRSYRTYEEWKRT